MDSIIYRTILSKKQYDEQIRGTASLARVRIIFIGYLRSDETRAGANKRSDFPRWRGEI